jgi:serine/threonine protein kinase
MAVAGYVTKEGGSYKSWKRRFMVIEGNDVVYYKKENRKEKCGVIQLVSSCVVHPIQYKGKKHCFEIKTPSRDYHVCAVTELDMERWIKGINEVLKPSNKDHHPASKQNGLAAHNNNHHRDHTQNHTQQQHHPQSTQNHKDHDHHGAAQPKKIGFEDFTIRRVIGQGSFGKVLMVTKKDAAAGSNDKVYAMKVLNKSTIIARNEVDHTKSEKSILMKLEHPFLVKLHYSFQTPDKLFFIMDYINGGELFFHLQRDKKFSEERVRFYAAEIVSGLDYLHTAGVIYRDLKPENLLLTREGHIVMTDFGLSKEGLHDKFDRTGTFCGTPEYLAPEVLEGKGYTKAVDWWSFGTLVYEMLTGLPPFYSEDVQEMYSKIMTADLEFPTFMSADARDLLSKLLERNDETRLQDATIIKKHPFFKHIDWEALKQKKISPPFIPEVTGDDDITNIDEAFTGMDIETCLNDNDNEEGVVSPNDFEGFTYNPHANKT